MRFIIFLFLCLPQFVTAQNHLEKLDDGLKLLEASEAFYSQHQYDSAYSYAKKGLAISNTKNNDSLAIITILSLLKTTNHINVEEQQEYFELAETKALQSKDWDLLMDVYYTMGRNFYDNRAMGNALPYFLKVDSIAEVQIIKSELVIKALLARSEISRTTFTKESVDIAHKMQLEALTLAEEIENTEMIYDIYVRLADMEGLKGNYSETKRYLDLSLVYYLKANNATKVARIYLTYANYYYAVNDYPKAGEKLKEGIAYLKSQSEPTQLARLISAYGTFFRKRLKDCNQAIPQYQEAREIYRTLNDTTNDGCLYLLEGLALCSAELKDYENAYSYYQATYETKKAIVKKANNNLTRNLETKYRTEKKEQEIALLASQNKLAEEEKKNLRNLLIGGVVLTIISGLFFFFQYRNRQITNEKLKELDKAKSTFFTNISHEFRTPLSLIKGPLEDQLNRQNLGESEARNLKLAKKNTLRMERLVSELLALAKLESGKLKLNVQPGSLGAFLAAQVASFGFSAAEKNIQIKSNIKSSNKTTWFDRDALEKIVSNLIGNAVKYTPEGGEITINGELRSNSYHIAIKNMLTEGATIDINRIFDRFYQSSESNIGSGIGLALTKDLVELHHGEIHAKLENDNSIRFDLRIPISESEFSQIEQLSNELRSNLDISEVNQLDQATNTKLDNDAAVLLIVDDNVDIRTYLTGIFESEYDIHTAENGQDGFAKAEALIPDVIISDLKMPIEDGYTLTQNCKSSELTFHIPIILLTAKDEDENQLKSAEFGVDAFISKPFSSSFLQATVANLLQTRRKLQDRYSNELILKTREIAVTSTEEQFLNKLQEVLDKSLTNSDFSTNQFSVEMHMSRMQLHRKLKALTGLSTSEFLRSQRLNAAANLIKQDKISISEVGYSVGFNDPSYFTKCFKQEFGVSPTQFAKNK